MKLEQLVRGVLIAIGLLTLVAGAVIMAQPSLAAGMPFGSGTITAIGVVAVGMGLWLVRSRFRSKQIAARMPIVELPPSYPVPGSDVDEMIADMTERRQGTLEVREQIEERLRETALAVIAQREDCTTAEAEAQLESGEWTDSSVAASFFGASSGGASSGGLLSGGGNQYRDRVETTIDAILGVADVSEMTGHDSEAADDEGLVSDLGGRVLGSEDDTEIVRGAWNSDTSSFETFDVEPGTHVQSVESTGHWHGVSAFGLVSIGAGIAVTHAGLMVAGAIAVGYAAYTKLSPDPSIAGLEVERQLSEEQPAVGEEVRVTVTVENNGTATVPDLRIVDVVPDSLTVTKGSPRIGTALRPDASVTFSYTVVAQRGEHEWPAAVAARDFSGQQELTGLIAPETTLFCAPDLRTQSTMPVRSQTSQLSGNVDTEIGGIGLEFFSQREYQSGDAMKRVNWKHLARTGDLATVEYREEKSATVTLLFDARESAYLTHELGQPHALDRSIEAATEVFPSLYDDGNLIGIAAFDTVPCWLAPSSGNKHLERARMLFAQHPALSSIPPGRLNLEKTYVDPMTHVRRQLPSNSQIIMFSPLNDDYAKEVARRLDSAGHLVTIISPDTTASRTAGQRLAWIERFLRVIELQERGIRVIDWKPDEEMRLSITKAAKRWSA